MNLKKYTVILSVAVLCLYYSTTFTSVVCFCTGRKADFCVNDVRAFFSLFFPFRLLFGEPQVSSKRFLVSFPFEPASSLTPAFPGVFPGSSVAFLFSPAFPFRVLFALSFPSFSFSFFRSLRFFPFPLLSFRSFSCPLRSLSHPLHSLVFLFESSSKGRRSRRPVFVEFVNVS